MSLIFFSFHGHLNKFIHSHTVLKGFSYILETTKNQSTNCSQAFLLNRYLTTYYYSVKNKIIPHNATGSCTSIVSKYVRLQSLSTFQE